MATERRPQAMGILCIVEIVVALRVSAERRIIDVRRQSQRRAAAPTPYQFRGEQFLLGLGFPICAEEAIERADTRLVLAVAHIRAVAAQNIRMRHRQGNAGLAWIAKNEFTGLDRPPLARKR